MYLNLKSTVISYLKQYPKPNEQCFNRFKNRDGYYPEIFDVEERYTEGDYLPQNKADSEDYFAETRHDTSTVTDLSPRSRSYIPSNKRNKRTNYYDSNEKYDEEKKGNFYYRSNSYTRGRRYGANSHEKYNNKNQNYQDARTQNYDSEVNNKRDCAQISNESLNEASESIYPSDKECFQNNQPECDVKDESKKRDGPYIVLSQRSPPTLVVASCDKPDEPLGVHHTSALTPFLNGTETQSPQEKRKATEATIDS
ncbi:ubiquitin domain-containing protein UBFD1 [Trichonephila inaurata madagascariensis]|uniref:Ubiquitin domain-containing protein UBFD1 n=1 Tax=Trichonephila inaurata madagascariensis TaxID=2747483 RepID=A0A8X6WTK2_9ARAC|nr:ubiquitin domain-containing protein UBFD1 [Trichonephila inaurata madagascariensis]